MTLVNNLLTVFRSIVIVYSVSSRESERYLDENSKRYTSMLGNTLDIVGRSPSSEVLQTSHKHILESNTDITPRREERV